MPVPSKNTSTMKSTPTKVVEKKVEKKVQKVKKFKPEKVEKTLSQADKHRLDVSKMFYRPSTYENLFYQVNVEGSSQAGEVIAMRIRTGYVRKDEVSFLRMKLEGNNNPHLASARQALAIVNY